MSVQQAAMVVVAAGSGERLKRGLPGKEGPRKAFVEVAGAPLLRWTLQALRRVAEVGELIVVLHPDDFADEALKERVRGWGASKCVRGGARRQDSVLAGIRATRGERGALVGVHDAARPLVQPGDLRRVIEVAAEHGAAILGGPAQDTVKEVDGEGRVVRTHSRARLRMAQTPQVARKGLLLDALSGGGEVTDEAMALEAAGHEVRVVLSEGANLKLTTAADLAIVEALLQRAPREARPPSRWRIGEGSDIHKLVEGRPLWLGGLEVPHSAGALGHSDGDVVLHALVDALLGAIGGGDIGELFPDDDPRNAGRASREFVAEACRRVREAGYEVANADITIHAERPKLAPHKAAIRAEVTALLEAAQRSPVMVNIKAKTNEGLDAVGRREAIAARATVLLVRAVN